MQRRKRRTIRSEDENLWLTNIEFSGNADKLFVKAQLIAIAEKIAQLRKRKKLSQESLAELTRVSVSTIKFIEQKQRVPSLALLLKIIHILDRDAILWK